MWTCHILVITHQLIDIWIVPSAIRHKHLLVGFCLSICFYLFCTWNCWLYKIVFPFKKMSCFHPVTRRLAENSCLSRSFLVSILGCHNYRGYQVVPTRAGSCTKTELPWYFHSFSIVVTDN